MRKSLIISILALCCFYTSGFAQFMENKGQWPDHVLFAFTQNNATYFIEKSGITIDLAHPHDIPDLHSYVSTGVLKKDVIRQHAVKLSWQNSTWNGELTFGDALPGYTNWLSGPVENHVGHIYSYKSFTLHEVWPGVDIDFHSSEKGLKYDYRIKPSAHEALLPQLIFTGQDSLRLINGKLHIHTSCGTLIEHIPETYQISPEGDKCCNQNASYRLENALLCFILEDEPLLANELVIDPELIVATYVGAGPNLNQNLAVGLGSDFFPDGSFLATAVVTQTGWVYPITAGVYSNLAQNGFRSGITRFNADGSEILWSTVIGGGGETNCLTTLVLDDALVLMLSSAQIPGSSQYLPSTVEPLIGPSDINNSSSQYLYCLVLSHDGSELLRSRALSSITTLVTNWLGNGSNSPNRAAAVQATSDGDYVMVFSTNNENVPVTESAFDSQNTSNNPDNTIDAVVLRISPDLQDLRWCTFYGGEHRDFGLDLVLDDNDRPIIVGTSYRSSAVTTPDTWISNIDFTLSYNGFIAIFSADGSTLEAATHVSFPPDLINMTQPIGDSEVIRFVDLDPNGDIWVYGYAASNSSDIFISEGAYNNPTSRGFICKFNPELSELLISSRVGFDPQLRYAPTAFMVDNCGYIYTSANSAPPNDGVTPGWILQADLTEDALQDSGGFYLAVYEPDMAGLHYATLFGGDHSDGGNSKFDKKGVVYQAVCVPPFEIGFNPTPNAWSTEQGLNYELGVFKMDFESQATTAVLQATVIENNPCLPHVVEVQNFSTAGEYTWWLNGLEVTPDENNLIEINEGGIIELQLAVYNPETCNTTDTVRTVLVLPEVQQPIAQWNLATPDPCDPAGGILNAIFTGQNTDSLTWLAPLGTLTNENSIEVPVLEPGNYPITVIASESQCGFADTLSFVYVHNPLVLSVDTSASNPCSLPVIFNGTFTGIGHDNLTWSVNNEVSSDQNEVIVDLPQGSHTITLVAQSAQCGSLSQSFQVNALGTVQATLSELPESICLGQSIALSTSADNGTFTWLAEGNASNGTDFVFAPQQTGNSSLVLIHSDALSCNGADTAQAFIQVVQPPVADFQLTYLPELCQTEAEVMLVFTGNAAESLFWEMGDGSTYTSSEVQHTFTEPGLFQITLTVEAPPCPSETYSEEVPIELMASDVINTLMYPNIFSPNDDGINDCLYFLPEGSSSENIDDFSLRVFNRWGTLIYESEAVGQRWCPRDLEQGTYYYILRYFDRCTGESVAREAAVTVVY